MVRRRFWLIQALETEMEDLKMICDISFYDLLGNYKNNQKASDAEIEAFVRIMIHTLTRDLDEFDSFCRENQTVRKKVYVNSRIHEADEATLREDERWRTVIGERPEPPVLDADKHQKLTALREVYKDKSPQRHEKMREILESMREWVNQVFHCQDYEWRIAAAIKLFFYGYVWKCTPCGIWKLIKDTARAAVSCICSCVGTTEHREEEEPMLLELMEKSNEMTMSQRLNCLKYMK